VAKDLPCNLCGELMTRVKLSAPDGKARCRACRRAQACRPQVGTLPCNLCGELMWRRKTSLPDGEARCRPCRQSNPQPTGFHTPSRLRVCPWCSEPFTAKRQIQKFCSRACFAAADGKRRQIRGDDDPHQRRCDRAKAAPGLSYSARRRLLARWKRQGRLCAYCDAMVSTLDHVVPLVRGGTNYEGNLVPCCKRCNSSKSYRLIVEWPRFRAGVAWSVSVMSARASTTRRVPGRSIATVGVALELAAAV
jgi:5-methylcytosine-specific restriction endonuclease McrA